VKNKTIENKWHAKFLYWPRKLKQSLMVISDSLAIFVSLYLSHVLRFNDFFPESLANRPFWETIVLIFLGIYVFSNLGLYRSVVRFLDHKLFLSVTKGSIILGISLFVLDNFW